MSGFRVGLLALMGISWFNMVVATADPQWQFSLQDPSETFNFLATADWGHDTAGQYACAAGMGAVAKEINATMVLMLGDNFYPAGIHSSTDGPDGQYRFNKTFEQVYSAPALLDIPFHAIAGNHDWLGNVSAQIAYSKRSETRFNFPSYWYNVTQIVQFEDQQVELEVLLYDTVIMAGNSDVQNPDGTVTELRGNQLPGPPDPDLAKKQMDWLEDRMSHSTADYLWVGGHYPVWAAGRDPPTGVNQKLRPLLHKWEAQYVNGHEHDLEHIIENNTKTNFICTGAGMECCYDDTNVQTVPMGAIKFAMTGAGGSQWQQMPFEMLSGFTSYRMGPRSMQVVYHAHNGTVLYSTPPILPRTKQPQPPIGPPGPFYPPAPPSWPFLQEPVQCKNGGNCSIVPGQKCKCSGCACCDDGCNVEICDGYCGPCC